MSNYEERLTISKSMAEGAKAAKEPISYTIRKRLQSAGIPFHANDTIAEHLKPGEREELKREIEGILQQLYSAMVIDTENDHNTKETAKRVAKMYIDEVFHGRYHPMPRVTEFPNAKKLDEIYTLGPITVRSACSHHFVPITGECWVGVIPSGKVIGISKFVRIANWVMSRPQIQEEAVVQLADILEELLQPKGLALVVRASHMCMTWRGVKENHTCMANSIVRGNFMHNTAARAEFFDIIKGQGY